MCCLANARAKPRENNARDAEAAVSCPPAIRSCNAPTRILVEDKIRDEFVALMAKNAKPWTPADPLDPNTSMGAVIDKDQMNRVLGYIAEGRKEGATVAAGGAQARQDSGGAYIEPTVFTDVRNDMKIAQEEIFGPVLVVIPFEDEEDAIRIANDSEYGLSGGVISADEDKALAIARRIRTGTIGVNGGMAMDVDLAFGGYKQSGIGKEWGAEGFDEYLDIKAVGIGIPG